jgi:hypothetical protein
MTVGQIVDFIVEYNERQNTDSKPTARKATQADINSFFGG